MSEKVNMQVDTTSQFKNYTEVQLLKLLIQFAMDKQFSVATWQLPGQTKKQLLISRNNKLVKREIMIEELPEGFIIAPFDRNENSVFLSADYKFTFVNGALAPAENEHEIASHDLLKSLFQSNISAKPTLYDGGGSAPSDSDKDHFIQFIEEGIAETQKGLLEKVVPSRTHTIPLPENFDVMDNFEKLCASFPNAMVSFVSSPQTGSWMGATPELLVCVDQQSFFKTVALAGTQPYHEGINLKSVAWTQKEIEEQALVERYIISCFKKIRLREYEEQGPKTVIAGNLMHLRSDFTVDMKETNFPQLGSVMLQLLHPTSAVCGMPLEPALDFLKRKEGYNRSFYAGFLGPVNVDSSIHIFVNLRCMQICNTKLILYAGAGITSDSVPENEWTETEMKLNTLLTTIN